MQKIKIKIPILLISVFIPTQLSVAKLSGNFRDNFPEFVSNLCASTLNYDLDREFNIVQKEYGMHINCIFNEAFSGAVKTINKDVKTALGKNLLLATPESISSECQGIFSQTQKLQQNLRLSNNLEPTMCDSEDKNPTVKNPYSSCRVSEMVLSEWCGYQKYLEMKRRDDKSQFEFLELGAKKNFFTDFGDKEVSMDEQIDHELEKSEVAMKDALLLYQKFEQNYRMHAWLTALRAELNQANSTFDNLMEVFRKYPEKFINASTH